MQRTLQSASQKGTWNCLPASDVPRSRGACTGRVCLWHSPVRLRGSWCLFVLPAYVYTPMAQLKKRST
ncbi:hypothetical protein WJX72_010065 [[Myrmecia] bisecta]|uniref:Uncharacterized protein n=1 Tax=[Myrmecia] bisecta TaxID=41462 RepID=A0AAW1QSL5_9CHLO